MDCRAFLAWAMPRLGLEPGAFARVRRQVCKRLGRRVAELQLADLDEYARYVDAHSDEWPVLDGLCHVTISRFYRDRPVFDALRHEIVPRLARSRAELRFWSAGSGAGEEPYTLALITRRDLPPETRVEIVATDADPHQLARARAAIYRPSSFRELPADLPPAIDADLVRRVTFLQQDLRREAPDGPFALVTCRNLAFSYFDAAGRERALARISERLEPGGILVVGLRETLPASAAPSFTAIGPCLFEKRAG